MAALSTIVINLINAILREAVCPSIATFPEQEATANSISNEELFCLDLFVIP